MVIQIKKFICLGEYIYDRKAVLKSKLSLYFFLELVSIFPYSLLKYLSTQGYFNGEKTVFIGSNPRIYTMLVATKFIRIFTLRSQEQKFLRFLNPILVPKH